MSAAPRHRPRSAKRNGHAPAPCSRGRTPAIPIKQLQPVPLTAAEREHRPARRLLSKDVLCQGSQSGDPLPHVGRTAGEIHPHPGPGTDHADSTSRINLARSSSLIPPRRRSSCPLRRMISTRVRCCRSLNRPVLTGRIERQENRLAQTGPNPLPPKLPAPLVDVLACQIMSASNLRDRHPVNANLHQDRQLLIVRPTAPPLNANNHLVPHNLLLPDMTSIPTPITTEHTIGAQKLAGGLIPTVLSIDLCPASRCD